MRCLDNLWNNSMSIRDLSSSILDYKFQEPQIQKSFKLGFLPVHNSKCPFRMDLLGTLWRIYAILFNASPKRDSGILSTHHTSNKVCKSSISPFSYTFLFGVKYNILHNNSKSYQKSTKGPINWFPSPYISRYSPPRSKLTILIIFLIDAQLIFQIVKSKIEWSGIQLNPNWNKFKDGPA